MESTDTDTVMESTDTATAAALLTDLLARLHEARLLARRLGLTLQAGLHGTEWLAVFGDPAQRFVVCHGTGHGFCLAADLDTDGTGVIVSRPATDDEVRTMHGTGLLCHLATLTNRATPTNNGEAK